MLERYLKNENFEKEQYRIRTELNMLSLESLKEFYQKLEIRLQELREDKENLLKEQAGIESELKLVKADIEKLSEDYLKTKSAEEGYLIKGKAEKLQKIFQDLRSKKERISIKLENLQESRGETRTELDRCLKCLSIVKEAVKMKFDIL